MVWVGTKSDGLYRVAAAGTSGATVVDHFPADGTSLPIGSVDVYRLGGSPAFLSEHGLQRFDSRTRTFLTAGWTQTSEALRGLRPLRVVNDGSGRTWVIARAAGDVRRLELRVFGPGPAYR